jgi:hypothetical protein
VRSPVLYQSLWTNRTESRRLTHRNDRYDHLAAHALQHRHDLCGNHPQGENILSRKRSGLQGGGQWRKIAVSEGYAEGADFGGCDPQHANRDPDSRTRISQKDGFMNRKRFAAMLMTGCLLSSVGCSTSGSGSGLFSSSSSSGGGCCGHGGLFSRFGRSSSPSATPVAAGMYAGPAFGGADCPCSHSAGSGDVFHPAVMTQGMPVTGPATGDFGATMIPQGAQFPTQPMPVTTPAYPQGVPQVPGGAAPRIQPVPMAPNPGIAPMGTAPATQWTPQ